jgi:hypothetical protein
MFRFVRVACIAIMALADSAASHEGRATVR